MGPQSSNLCCSRTDCIMNPSLLPQNPLIAPQCLEQNIQIPPYSLEALHNPLCLPTGIRSSHHGAKVPVPKHARQLLPPGFVYTCSLPCRTRPTVPACQSFSSLNCHFRLTFPKTPFLSAYCI